MEKIKIIKITLTNSEPQELNLLEVSKTFIFDRKAFENCETIEEVRDEFENNYNGSFVYDYIQIKTYISKENFDIDNFLEYIGE